MTSAPTATPPAVAAAPSSPAAATSHACRLSLCLGARHGAAPKATTTRESCRVA
jgi:hypothetical protein